MHLCRESVLNYFARVAANPDPVVAVDYDLKAENAPVLPVPALSSPQSRNPSCWH